MTNTIANHHNYQLKLGIDIIDLQNEIAELNKQLRETELYKQIEYKQNLLQEAKNTQQFQLNVIKEQMIENGITEITINDWELKLKQTPGALKIEDEEVLPAKYMRKKEVWTVDKMAVKRDLEKGLILPGVTIEKTINLDIKKIQGEKKNLEHY